MCYLNAALTFYELGLSQLFSASHNKEKKANTVFPFGVLFLFADCIQEVRKHAFKNFVSSLSIDCSYKSVRNLSI